jgi:hypothetical protein
MAGGETPYFSRNTCSLKLFTLGLIYIENSTQNLISVHSQRLVSAASKREHTSDAVFRIRLKRIWTCVRCGIEGV